MRTEQIRYFLETVKTGSFTKAAENLHIQQPSLREAIISLENELGRPLFNRSKKGVQLNEYGLACLPYLQSMMNIYEKTRSGEILGSMSGENRFVIEAQSSYDTYAVLVHNIFAQQFPQKYLRINTNNSIDSMINHLANNKCDLAFLSLADETQKAAFWNKIKLNGLQSTLFKESEIKAIIRKDHPLAKRKCIMNKDFYDYALVFRASFAPVSGYLEKKVDLDKCDIIKVDSHKLTEYYCKSTNAITFIPGETDIDEDLIAKPLEKPIRLDYFAVFRKTEISSEILFVINSMKMAVESSIG